MRLVKPAFRWSSPLVMMVCCLPASLALAAHKPAEQTMGPFTGTVVDPAGKPAAGAMVCLVGGEFQDLQATAKTTTDAKGHFRLPAVKWKVGYQSLAPTLTACDSRGRIGSVYHDFSHPSPPSSSKTMASVRITLHAAKDYRGRLVDTAGRPVARASIRPTLWEYTRRQAQRFLGQEVVFLSAEMAKERIAETGEDGSFVIRGLPATGRISMEIRHDRFDKLFASITLERPVTIRLSQPGGLRGTLTCQQDPKAVAALPVRVCVSSVPSGALSNPYTSDWQVLFNDKLVTQPNGTFSVERLPPGRCTLTPLLADASPYYVDDLVPVTVRSGETTIVSLTLKPAVKLQGKVVDAKSGAGVAGVHLMLYYQDQRGNGGRQNPATSDANGEFTFYARPGRAAISVWQFPDQYVNPSYGRQQRTIEVKEGARLDPIRLERASVLQGIVVDKASRPVADAQIRYNSLDSGAMLPFNENLRSDAAGKFTIKNMPAKARLSVRARTKTAATEPVNVIVGESPGPIRLVADEKTSFTVRGTVVDEAGQPVPKATVTLMVHLWFGRFGTSFGGDTGTTDAAGKFQFGGLWAGDKYDVEVTAKGFDKSATPIVEGTVGGVHDFGKITLVGTNGVVEGKVVDSSGKPLADVRVFNSGDGAEPMETRSNAAGKFRLQGFRSGPVYVFAEKDGCRFAGLQTTAGVTNAVVKVLRNDEPPPRWAAPPPAMTREEGMKWARQLLNRLVASKDKDVRKDAGRKLAELLRKREARAPKTPRTVKASSLKPGDLQKVAETDMDEALSLIPKDHDKAYRELKGLAEHFASSDRERAMRFASEAILHARSQDDPVRTLDLAELGRFVASLGNKAVGEKLVREAADLGTKWASSSERREWYAVALARTIAAVDLDSALKLSKKVSQQRRSSCVANIAVTLDDLPKAESLLKSVEPWYAARGRARLAYRIAATRPAEAVRLVEGISAENGQEDTKAAAFGWLATVIVARDPALAHKLIDRAFVIYLHPSDRSQNVFAPRAAQRALLAYQAGLAGYPDMESVIYRTLAMRPTGKNAWNPAAAQEASVMVAMFLALVDPPAAKQMLQSLEANSEAIGSGYSGVGRREWLKAWAIVDPPHTVDLAQRELAVAQDQNAKQMVGWAVMEIVDLWTCDPKDRVKRLIGYNPNIFSPDQEY